MFENANGVVFDSGRSPTTERAVSTTPGLAGHGCLLDDLLRGGLEVLSIRRVDAAYVVSLRAPLRRRRGLSRKERAVFERLVRGRCPKELAYTVGVALATA